MYSILTEAGWPIWPLLATSVAGLALIIERLLFLRRGRVVPVGLEQQIVEMLRHQKITPQALYSLENHSPLGRILAEVVKHRRLPPQELRVCVESAGRAEAHRLRRYLSALGTIAVIAPLMGLFGTVVGMIEIFGAYTPMGGDPAQLAHGISVALYNTGLGILIAIPAMIFHRYFRSLIEDYLHESEQAATRLMQQAAL